MGDTLQAYVNELKHRLHNPGMVRVVLLQLAAADDVEEITLSILPHALRGLIGCEVGEYRRSGVTPPLDSEPSTDPMAPYSWLARVEIKDPWARFGLHVWTMERFYMVPGCGHRRNVTVEDLEANAELILSQLEAIIRWRRLQPDAPKGRPQGSPPKSGSPDERRVGLTKVDRINVWLVDRRTRAIKENDEGFLLLKSFELADEFEKDKGERVSQSAVRKTAEWGVHLAGQKQLKDKLRGRARTLEIFSNETGRRREDYSPNIRTDMIDFICSKSSDYSLSDLEIKSDHDLNGITANLPLDE